MQRTRDGERERIGFLRDVLYLQHLSIGIIRVITLARWNMRRITKSQQIQMFGDLRQGSAMLSNTKYKTAHSRTSLGPTRAARRLIGKQYDEVQW